MDDSIIIEKALSGICSYSRLSDVSKGALAKSLQIITTEKKSILVYEGQHSDRLFFIVEGAAKAYYMKNDKSITDWFAFENQFICAINSYFLEIPSPHYIETIERSILTWIKRKDFQLLCDAHHDIERLARLAVTKTMLQIQQRIVGIQFESAEQRYTNLIQTHSGILKRVALGDIASYLGITQETLSRIRSNKTLF